MYRHLLLAVCLTSACGFRNANRELDEDIIADEAVASADGDEDPSQLRRARRTPPKGAESLIEDLASPERAAEATAQLVDMGAEALPALEIAASAGYELAVRGRAIVALSQIDAPEVDGLLLAIQDDTQDELLARTWAAAARVNRAQTLDDVLGFAPLLATFPGLERPIKLRVEATAGELEDVSGALRMIEADPNIGAVLTDAVLAAGAEPLVTAMLTGPTQQVRMLAAGYLATLAQQDKAAVDAVIDGLRYKPGAEAVPWEGGPLYVPSLSYRGDQARSLVGALITWYLYADEENLQEQKQQVYNNLQSVNLIRPAGLQWAPNEPTELLKAWGQAVGPEAIEKILAELGLTKNSRYAAVVKDLK